MKLRSLCVALVLLAGSGSIGLAQSDRYTPRLSEIMRMAQTQHLKLWLAAKAQTAHRERPFFAGAERDVHRGRGPDLRLTMA